MRGEGLSTELAAKVSETAFFRSLEERLAALDQESEYSKPPTFKDEICSWGQNRDSDQNRLGQEARSSLMLVDVL